MKTWRIQCRHSGSVAAEMRFGAQNRARGVVAVNTAEINP